MLTRETDLSIYHPTQRQLNAVSYIWICDREEDIDQTLDQYIAAINEQSLPGNLVVINNGLGDRISQEMSHKLKDEGVDAAIINFNVRTAESSALTLALKQTSGDIVVLLPSYPCLLYTSPSPRDLSTSRMPSSA